MIRNMLINSAMTLMTLTPCGQPLDTPATPVETPAVSQPAINYCAYEDGQETGSTNYPCYWDGQLLGNGQGDSYWIYSQDDEAEEPTTEPTEAPATETEEPDPTTEPEMPAGPTCSG